MDCKELQERRNFIKRACAAYVLVYPRRWWVRPWIQRRLAQGNYRNLLQELREVEMEADFKSYLRMDPQMFDELLDRVSPYLTKMETHLRTPLEPGLKLAVTVRYLARGSTY